MSFILEALRKSEAERRRGQTPDLLSDALPVAPATRTPAHQRGRVIAIVATSLIALLLLAWMLRPDTPDTPDTRETAAAAATISPQAPAATAAMPALSKPAPLSPPPVQAAPNRTQPAPASEPAATTTARVAATQTVASTASTAPPEAPSARESTMAAPPAAPQIAAVEPPPAAAFLSPDVPLKLADLSSEERQQLPALKVSMHMWAPEAASRFAIIDGTRVNEGDRVGDAIVETIQQDGVMLSWRGRRIRLQLR